VKVKERVFLLEGVGTAGACAAPEVTVTQRSSTSGQRPPGCSLAAANLISPTRRWWTELREARQLRSHPDEFKQQGNRCSEYSIASGIDLAATHTYKNLGQQD
jgi:hypothetical protein